LYPLLYTLEEAGYIQGLWQRNTRRKKRVYEITSKGEELLVSSLLILDRLTNKIRLKSDLAVSSQTAGPKLGQELVISS
ncbi:MAG: hypothetical protein GTN76_13720, partial [Candidatus Aenigmarchaeota archaeon]|nr:hypothetical protein [Candidatus Aenigmarchaeota archaeon]